jgi:S1-C subfamily serine protease
MNENEEPIESDQPQGEQNTATPPLDDARHDAPTVAMTPAEPAPQPTPSRRRKPLIAIAIATAAVVGIGGVGTATVALLTRPSTSATSATTTTPHRNAFGQFGPRSNDGGLVPGGTQSQGQLPGASTSNVSAATASTAAQKVGVVTIKTTLDYDSSEQAAGTGMILSSDGLILTNNHVVEGSTSISVTVESTNKTYTAVVVGTDATADVAVLKLVGASGLTPVTLNPDEKVAVGDAIHSVGNAEGTGDLVTASGTVGAVDQSLTISSDFSTKGEQLSGLIELNSDVVSGDSGGPLLDKSGDVIGIVTAASTGSATVTGYAINIASVVKVVNDIGAGKDTSDIVIGYPAFLGVGIATTTTTVAGVPVGSVFSGTPAAEAGITAGSVITRINSTTVTAASRLSSLIAAHSVGDKISVTWTTPTGVSKTATVTLVGGPAA